MNESEAVTKNRYLLFAIFGAALLAWLSHLAHLYPYYFSWDMDLVTTEDFLVLGSGSMPDHQVHPGVGMLVVLKWIAPVAKWLGVLSANKVEDLSSAVSPILVMADTAAWVRSLTPIILFLIGAFSADALARHYKLSSCRALALLVMFSLAVYSTVHMVYSRTEQYSALYLVIAWWFLLVGAQSLRMIFAAGFFLGLAFFTKMQSLILVMTSFVLLFHIYQTQNLFKVFEPKLKQKIFDRVVHINLAIFLIISLLSYIVRMGDSVHHNRSGFGITPWWLLITVFLLASSHVQFHKPKWFSKNWLAFTGIAGILFAGWLSSLLIHFLLYSDPLLSLRHLLLTFKICMLGHFVPSQYEQLADARGVDQFLKHKYLLIIGLFALASVVWSWRFSIKRAALLKYLPALMIFVALAVNTHSATRNLLRQDIIWFELPILFMSFYFLFAVETPKWIRHVATALIVVYAAYGFFNSTNVGPRAPYYSMSESMYYKNGYGGNEDKVKTAMDLVYDESVDRNSLSVRVRHPNYDFHNWQMALPETKVALQAIGIMQNGLPVFRNHQWRITQLAPNWQNASTLDLSEPSDVDLIHLRYLNDQRAALFVEISHYAETCELLTQQNAVCAPKPQSVMTLLDKKTGQKTELAPIFLFKEAASEDYYTGRTINLSRQSLKGLYFLAQIDYAR